MNRQRSIAVFAAIAAIAMTTIGLSGVSATPLMVSSNPTSLEGMGMLGHVEYTIRDSENNIVEYSQGDNIVVHSGKDCTSRMLFGAADDAGVCDVGSVDAFNYIAIGNGTSGESITAGALTFAGDRCGDSGAIGTAGGELARKLATVTLTTAATGTAGTVVELETPQPFTFSNAGNATGSGNTITQSGLFNGLSTDDTIATYDGGSGTGECAAAGVNGTDWQMFSLKDLNGGSGIAVTDGDSLSVKWTITVGGP